MTAKNRMYLVLPVCLLLLNALEELLVYKFCRSIHNPYYLTAALLLMFAIGFTVVADLLAPWVVGLLEGGQRTSRRQWGKAGPLLFVLLLFAAVYFLYFVIYTKGPQYLIPPFWR